MTKADPRKGPLFFGRPGGLLRQFARHGQRLFVVGLVGDLGHVLHVTHHVFTVHDHHAARQQAQGSITKPYFMPKSSSL